MVLSFAGLKPLRNCSVCWNAAYADIMLHSYCIHTSYLPYICSAVAVYIYIHVLHCSVRWKYSGIYASYTLLSYFFAANAGIILLDVHCTVLEFLYG